jgi:hypothetical protein
MMAMTDSACLYAPAIAKVVTAAAQRETGHDLSEALHQHDICENFVRLGIENSASIGRDSQAPGEASTSVQFSELLKMLGGKVEEPEVARAPADSVVEEIDATLGKEPSLHW